MQNIYKALLINNHTRPGFFTKGFAQPLDAPRTILSRTCKQWRNQFQTKLAPPSDLACIPTWTWRGSLFAKNTVAAHWRNNAVLSGPCREKVNNNIFSLHDMTLVLSTLPACGIAHLRCAAVMQASQSVKTNIGQHNAWTGQRVVKRKL